LTGSALCNPQKDMRACQPEPSSANRTGYYVESANAHPLPIAKLGHFTAHIYCVHTITLRGLDRDVTEQKLDLIQFAAG